MAWLEATQNKDTIGSNPAVLAHCLYCFAQARGGSHPALPYIYNDIETVELLANSEE